MSDNNKDEKPQEAGAGAEAPQQAKKDNIGKASAPGSYMTSVSGTPYKDLAEKAREKNPRVRYLLYMRSI